jgi:isochorismate synthase
VTAIIALVARAPVVERLPLLAIAGAGDRVAWSPGRAEIDGRAWAIHARGTTLRLAASGADRWTALRAAAGAAWPTIEEVRGPGVVAPAPRFYGGAAFRVGGADGPTWREFGDAGFVLPRWEYGRCGDDAFVRVAVRADELADRAALDAELDGVVAALEVHAPAPPRRARAAVLAERDAAVWHALVREALHDIRTRELDKVVAARCSYVAAPDVDPVATVEALARDNPECACFAFGRGARAFVGASPERLVALDGTRVSTEALAGTQADARALLASDKDRREHAYVVDYIRRALAASCATIRVAREPQVRALRAVHHLCTPIDATVERGRHVLELVEALHPTPAVCGLPQHAASDWIAAHEPFARGWYAAPVGWFDRDGNGAFAVAIRSALVERDGAWLFAGAGIVEGSDPALEYGETMLKQRAMLAALGAAHRETSGAGQDLDDRFAFAARSEAK